METEVCCPILLTLEAEEYCSNKNNKVKVKNFEGKVDEVIILIKQGAIFEVIYNKVKDIICSHNLIWLEKQMIGLEKTYSLKIGNNNIDWKDKFYELEEEVEESERKLKMEIEHWKYLYQNKQS